MSINIHMIVPDILGSELSSVAFMKLWWVNWSELSLQQIGIFLEGYLLYVLFSVLQLRCDCWQTRLYWNTQAQFSFRPCSIWGLRAGQHIAQCKEPAGRAHLPAGEDERQTFQNTSFLHHPEPFGKSGWSSGSLTTPQPLTDYCVTPCSLLNTLWLSLS